MGLQTIKGSDGENIGVFVPIDDWNEIVKKHEDLKDLVNLTLVSKVKLSDLFGKLSDETAEAMRKEIEESRNEWEERLNNQF
jgi:hypothetical protein